MTLPTGDPEGLDPDRRDAKKKDEKKAITPTRIALWVLVGGAAIYYIVSGLIGVIRNG